MLTSTFTGTPTRPVNTLIVKVGSLPAIITTPESLSAPVRIRPADGSGAPIAGGGALPATGKLPTPTAPAGDSTSAPVAATGALSFTGLEVSTLVLVGLLLLVGGAGASFAERRRPAHAVPVSGRGSRRAVTAVRADGKRSV